MNEKHFLTTLVILIFSVSTLVAMGKKVDGGHSHAGHSHDKHSHQVEAQHHDSSQKQDVVTDVISVEGMTCGSCAVSVKTAAESLEGVAQCDVDLDKGTASVTYMPSKTNMGSIKSAITQTGFDVN